jgi:hypothetical protein
LQEDSFEIDPAVAQRPETMEQEDFVINLDESLVAFG